MTTPGGEAPLRFSNESKIRAQMRKRGWTDEQVHEALATAPVASHGKRGPALRYVHPTTGRSVIVDAASGEIFMWAGKGIAMTPEEIYVGLLDEGVDVCRPVPALTVGTDTYVILQPDDYDAADERWEFAPGSVVVVEQRQTSDGPIRAAVRRAWSGRIPA